MAPKRNVSPPRAGESGKRSRPSQRFREHIPFHINYSGLTQRQRFLVGEYDQASRDYNNVLRSYNAASSEVTRGGYYHGGRRRGTHTKEELGRRLEQLDKKIKDAEDELIQPVDVPNPPHHNHPPHPPPGSGGAGAMAVGGPAHIIFDG
jgi:hypothetical protein